MGKAAKVTRTFVNEGDVKKAVKKLLSDRKWFWWMPPANGFGKPNVDFNALRGGVFLALETKFQYNTPTANQRGFLETISAEGGFGFVITEKTLDSFEAWLDAFDRAAMDASHERPVAVEDGATMLEAMRIMTAPIHSKD